MLAFVFSLLLSFQTVFNLTAQQAHSSSPQYVILNHIIIEGNTKTKDAIIRRELDITAGDTLNLELTESTLIRNKNKIINTNLFNTVELHIQKIDSQNAYLLIRVTERWYLFPMIIFELADRNFNEWWYERGRDLSRTQYGFRLAHKNFRGRGEQLRGTVQFGFTKRFDLAYSIPYLDKAQKHGIGFDISYSQNKSVAYETANHKLNYLDAEFQLRDRFSAGIRFTRRNRFYSFHTLEARYNYHTVADTIARLNPDYFLHGRTTQQYLRLGYSFTINRRDISAYPLRGYYFDVDFLQSGVTPKEDIHVTSLYADYSIYKAISKKYFWTASIRGRASSARVQPYMNYKGFGYGQDFVRGYEYYVVDGQHYGLAKLTLKRELFNIQKTLPNLIPMKQFQTVPVALYFKIYGDAGYVADHMYNPEYNRLANTMLYGGGIGLDLVTFYNTVFRVDFSINRSLERGVFLHFVKDI